MIIINSCNPALKFKFCSVFSAKNWACHDTIKMSYDTIPAEVSRYQVVSRSHPCSVVSLKLNFTK